MSPVFCIIAALFLCFLYPATAAPRPWHENCIELARVPVPCAFESSPVTDRGVLPVAFVRRLEKLSPSERAIELLGGIIDDTDSSARGAGLLLRGQQLEALNRPLDALCD
jgi:fido (protein-threonine AMPylation protein)